MNRIILYFCLLFNLYSCVEEPNEIPPIVNFEEPRENRLFVFPSTINVKAYITDDQMIKGINLRVFESQTNRNVLASQTFRPNSATFYLETTISITDSTLDNTDYYIELEVNDGKTQTNASVPIRIFGVEKRRLSLLGTSNVFNGSILYENDGKSSKVLYNYAKQTKVNAFYPLKQTFWSIPRNSKEAEEIEIKGSLLKRLFSVNSSFTDPYEDAFVEGNDVLISTKDAGLWRASNSNLPRLLYQPAAGKELGLVSANSDYIIVEEQINNGSNTNLTALFRSSGGIFNTLPIAGKLVGMVFRTKSKACFLTNGGGTMTMYEADLESGAVQRIGQVAGAQAVELTPYQSDQFMVLSDQGIFRYDYQRRQFYSISSNARGVHMVYDELNRSLLVASNSQILEYDPIRGTIIRPYNFPSAINQVSIRYNR